MEHAAVRSAPRIVIRFEDPGLQVFLAGLQRRRFYGRDPLQFTLDRRRIVGEKRCGQDQAET